MEPEEHQFYMGKLAQLEVRLLQLEHRLSALLGDDAQAKLVVRP